MRFASLSPAARRALLAAAALIPVVATAVPAAQAADDTPTIELSAAHLSGAVGATGDPTVEVTVGQDGTDAGELDVAATASSRPSVADTSDVRVSGKGATRTVSVDAQARGYADLTLEVTGSGGARATATLHYAASPKVGHSADARYLTGASDASAAVDVGDGHVVVANDEDNTLRLYDGSASGAPVETWNWDEELGTDKEVDIEGAARVGDTVYWLTSLGNDGDGEFKKDRDTVFTTTVRGSGASTDLAFGDVAHGLREQLVAWDEQHDGRLGFQAGTAEGKPPKEIDAFNVEGFEFAPGGGSTAYIGFRAPLVPPEQDGKALLVPVQNLKGFVTGEDAEFGDPVELDLGGLAVRDLRRGADGRLLILAGTWSEDDDAPQALYAWSGKPGDRPEKVRDLPAGDAGNWESVVSASDGGKDGARALLVTDDGSADLYGDGTEAKDLKHPEWQKSRSTLFELD